ncbi:CRISPR-associated protein Cas4 [Paenibacillus sambharensis]|uniref:CRISPR-associated exonuclease Cas4 n=1 Tax=Paenibacillus sambharensis TaxID=1803190 RepID=A0A2W1LB09_9BACL|nr:CRISPR-associated protein Cas4 [Paenibacillus sambharensis]PZD95909.1 CRISPR-associated protein Cas4 [Paenibacillus sambharensis]
MAYEEEDWLLLSGIQHFNFCRRQWALIHIEQQWAENVKTVEGNRVHKKADQPMVREKRGNKLVVRAMPVHSAELGLTGICDVVEFVQDPSGIALNGEEGLYLPIPVEYKRGRPKQDNSDLSQLTAQAMCLEAMLACPVELGYFYYDEIKHRVEVSITASHRESVRRSVEEMHGYYDRGYTPKVKTGPHCNNCSLKELCLPALMKKSNVSRYIEGRLLD